MHKQKPTTIISLIMASAVAIALVALPAFAHGGFEHVMGTVTRISAQSVTVETTAKKIVDVGINAKTTYTRNDKSVPAGDLKLGDRVVIDTTEADHKLTGASVKIGAASAADP